MSSITLPANATDEEVAAVLAVLLGPGGDRSDEDRPDDGYRLWRTTRLKALRDGAIQRRVV